MDTQNCVPYCNNFTLLQSVTYIVATHHFATTTLNKCTLCTKTRQTLDFVREFFCVYIYLYQQTAHMQQTAAKPSNTEQIPEAIAEANAKAIAGANAGANAEANAEVNAEATGEKRKKGNDCQSKTIVKNLAYNVKVSSLADDCYPLVLTIIDNLLKRIFHQTRTLMTENNVTRKTITPRELQPILDQYYPKITHIEHNTNGKKQPRFATATFKRQVKTHILDKNRISTSALKILQNFIEQTISHIFENANKVSKTSNRKRCLKRDVEVAWQMFNQTCINST